MRVLHRTSPANVKSILQHGFSDAVSTYMTDRVWSGVWVSDVALDVNDGGVGHELTLELDIPSDVFAEYGWVEDEKNYRESLIPARVLNGYGPPTVVSE